MIRFATPPVRRQFQRGFTMVELLMAMAIFAIGMLGLAALQVVSVSQGTGGRLRGTAAFLAHSVMDRATSEGQVTAAERQANTNGLPNTTAGWTFIGDASAVAKTDGAALLFDINGRPIAAADKTTPVVFTATWFSRTGTVNVGTRTALQEFVVNVTWKEADPKKGTALDTKAISVSRYVRI
ncbi:prepilin-type N-terminal cleavage/methylation domain-containing protein [Geothrix sp. SG200]|uniref:prepilin-type N-terminal cleavage/methylation domain-containing protein n=1 Tax=Geothrix sp. SG200 TaxID=2922865 RepID=UPI001FAE6156|nr:prepilin-type N-terminal cleavage/methylation domain-containing protein [Geothrix sp. SG200]